jgi:flagellar hook-length control protein FliK
LPQLQQLLAQAGISLGQTSVSDQGQTDQSFNESFGASRKTTAASTDGAIGSTAGLISGPAARSRAPDALVDTFA